MCQGLERVQGFFLGGGRSVGTDGGFAAAAVRGPGVETRAVAKNNRRLNKVSKCKNECDGRG